MNVSADRQYQDERTEKAPQELSSLIRNACRKAPSYVPAENVRPLALAYIGDTIFDLYVRSFLVMTTHLSPKQMHRKASSYANASAQAGIMKLLMPDLTEEETRIFKHARNQESLTVPKNMNVIDYKWATGLEALLGYLYLTGQDERCYALVKTGVERFDEKRTAESFSGAAKTGKKGREDQP